MKLLVLFALVAVAIAEPIRNFNPLSPTSRITGGVAISIEQIPYHVSIQAFGVHVCSGSIISETWILTAAHCFIFPEGWYTVRSGTGVTTSGGVVSSNIKIVIHEMFGTNWWSVPVHDVALVQVPPLTFGTTQAPIGMYSAGQQLLVGTPVVITGWGALSSTSNANLGVLQRIMMPIVASADCSLAYSQFGGIREGQICAGVVEELGRCQSDSGGPVTVNGFLAAIVSWGSACPRPEYLGVYTELSLYRDWITTKTGI